jgi:anti-anti-sigma factor
MTTALPGPAAVLGEVNVVSDWTRRYGCEVASQDRTWLVAVMGEIDLAAVPRIEAVLHLIEPLSDVVVLDLHAVSFMDSDAVGLLMRAADRAAERGYELTVARPSGVARQALEQCGLQDRVALGDQPAISAGNGMQRHALIATDTQNRLTDWNGAAEDLYGWAAWEAVGRLITTVAVCPQDEALAGEISRTVQRNEIWDGQFDVMRRNGSTFLARVREGLIRDPAGRAIGLLRLSVPGVAGA